eukprot:CAMPEP_0174968404 /NCGR_PEP_ID=MMETSP0004_2-20121128/8114_1 /TAXON_ID=420556 /ORGANISM="Ochromonas sp., Strain CCMP1393" /LENGTH=225 /DNA_ID=CAMNT_0016217631 /DNA_START=117 /DNA_END=794 /DNA_ORIENTATION=+
MAEDMTQLKLLTIGDSGVGKTWLLLRWAGAAGKLSSYASSMPTIGIDFKMKTTIVNGRRIKVQVWDTAGQERFRTITTSYYRHSQGILLVYDITDPLTFESIRSWMSQIRAHADQGISTILVGNKIDLTAQRAISYEEGAAMAKEFGIPFIETSGLNVEEAFTALTTEVYNRLEQAGMIAGGRNGTSPSTKSNSTSGSSKVTVSSADRRNGGGDGSDKEGAGCAC